MPLKTDNRVDFPLTLATIQTIAKRAEMDGTEALHTLRQNFGRTVADTILASFLHYFAYGEQRMAAERLCLDQATQIKQHHITQIENLGAKAFAELSTQIPRLQAWIATIVVLRLKLGSFDTCPPNPEINGRIERILTEHGIPIRFNGP